MHGSQPVDNVLLFHEVPERLEGCPGRWAPVPVACRNASRWDTPTGYRRTRHSKPPMRTAPATRPRLWRTVEPGAG